MGQRSQIYVRWNTKEGKMRLVPRYYQWNFGTRMISRARGIIEWLKGSGTYLDCGNEEKLRRIMDVNFDYKDVVLGSDIIDEWKDFANTETLNDFAFFGQDNNDGKLLIDMHIDWENKENLTFKYAFLTYKDDSPVLNGDQYMTWDTYYGEDNGNRWENEPYLEKEVKYTKRNIKWIEKNAKLMTAKEAEQFMNYNYASDMGLINIPFC